MKLTMETAEQIIGLLGSGFPEDDDGKSVPEICKILGIHRREFNREKTGKAGA